MPLAAVTPAVSVIAEPSVIEDDDAEREVDVSTTAEFAFKLRSNVMLCTRSPLTAHRLTGTVCTLVFAEAVNVRIEKPLVRVGALKDAVTPAGNPVMVSVTGP